MPDVLEDPIGYSESGMDEEMNFPNPVVRTDLPTRRRRWPRVLLGVAILGLLTIVFLPQILSSKVGRKFVISYISSKTNCPVTLQSFKTSWFGGTTVSFLSIYDPMGRHMGFKSLTCKASLLNLLRGKYKLGDTVIEGLNVDYMVDDGHGASTLDILRGPPGEGGGLLSNLSGNFTVNTGTITLIRGTVQPKFFNTTWQQAKLDSVEGKFEFQSLQNWKYSISADTVEDNGARGSLTSSGSIDLRTGASSPAKIDFTLSGENVRTGPLGAVMIAGATPNDVRQTLGALLKKVDISVKTNRGKLTFERCDISGETASIHLQPSIDLAANPPALVIDAPGSTISIGISNRLSSAVLVYLNPFFREAASGIGQVDIAIDQLRLPLTKKWEKAASAQVQLKTKSLKLNRMDEMSMSATLPNNLASQFALLTGDLEKSVVFDVAGQYSIADGRLTAAATPMHIGDTSSIVEGSTDLQSGAISMMATLISAPAISSHFQGKETASQVAISIGGTVQQPQLDMLNLKGDLSQPSLASLNDEINRQTARMQSKEAQKKMQKSQNEVDELLRPLRAPSTQPAGSGKK